MAGPLRTIAGLSYSMRAARDVDRGIIWRPVRRNLYQAVMRQMTERMGIIMGKPKTETEKRLDTLWERLVPASGNADTKAGEIVRALGKITYKWYNTGDRPGIGHGRCTCSASARFLMDRLPESISTYIKEHIWRQRISDKKFEQNLITVLSQALDYLEHAGLDKEPNNEDLLDWYDEKEDQEEIYPEDGDWY